MSCLPEADPEPGSSWQLWLDFWAQAARNDEVANVRRKSDERWRDEIAGLVLTGQAAGEFREVDPAAFAICLTALLDGLTVQIALEDPAVDPVRRLRAEHAVRRRPARVRLDAGPAAGEPQRKGRDAPWLVAGSSSSR